MEVTTSIRIRAFRATDDPESCLRYIEGHRRVLSIYGVEKIATNTDEWMFNPAMFVVVVESMDGKQLFGGARLQVANGVNPLPIEQATGEMDVRIHNVIRQYAQHGTAELSGLWNSKEVSGLGIGSFFPARTTIVIAEQLGLDSVFSLCSPVTVRFTEWIGARVFTDIGNNGTFYYPKIDLLATAVLLDDVANLSLAHPKEKEKMLYLRKNPKTTLIEKTPFHNIYVNVQYDLTIASANKEEFKIKY